MTTREAEEHVEAHEGAWAYVSGPTRCAESPEGIALYDGLAAAAEASGWQAYRTYRTTSAPVRDDPVPLVERLRYALDHADVCIFYVGRPSSGVGAELALAYARARPVIAVSLRDDDPSALISSLLGTYSRARVVVGDTPQACAAEVERVLADPTFAEIVREATAESHDDA
jgi:hypothetical protein